MAFIFVEKKKEKYVESEKNHFIVRVEEKSLLKRSIRKLVDGKEVNDLLRRKKISGFLIRLDGETPKCELLFDEFLYTEDIPSDINFYYEKDFEHLEEINPLVSKYIILRERRIVAIKKPVSKKSMLSEILALNRLKGLEFVPNLIGCLCKKHLVIGIVMEYIDNNQRLLSINNKDHVLQCIEHLDKIHEKHIIHRDIKPENIILNNIGKIFLCDFGSAIIEDNEISDTLGTPPYSEEDEKLSKLPETDFYSLGMCIAEENVSNEVIELKRKLIKKDLSTILKICAK